MEYVIAELILEHKKDSSWLHLENTIRAANRTRLAQQRANDKRATEASDKNTRTTRAKGAKASKKKPTKSLRPPKSSIDRRKLQEIAERHPNVTLSRHELELLDTFFIRNGGPGLAEIPVFRRKEDLFEVLNKADRVSFFVGVRFVEALGIDMIARWDISALSAMRDRLPRHVGTEAFDVETRDMGRPLEKREWEKLRSQASGNIVVSIGSPVACAGTGRQMSQMFGTVPPPVCFVHANAVLDNPFVRDPSKVPGTKSGDAALLVNEELYVSNPRGCDHGIVIGQRTGPDHAAFVVAGNGGPGTMAAAEFFATGQINVMLPRFSKKEKQPIVVAVMSTDIRPADVPAARRIDKRTVANTRMVTRPMVFEHINKGWVVTSE